MEKHKIEILIKEAEFKIKTLPAGYFVEYFKDEFIKKLKKYLQN